MERDKTENFEYHRVHVDLIQKKKDRKRLIDKDVYKETITRRSMFAYHYGSFEMKSQPFSNAVKSSYDKYIQLTPT